MHYEHKAYFNESATYQGLHNNDCIYWLWNKSWRTVDQHMMEQKRESAIQDEIHRTQQEQQKPVNLQ